MTQMSEVPGIEDGDLEVADADAGNVLGGLAAYDGVPEGEGEGEEMQT